MGGGTRQPRATSAFVPSSVRLVPPSRQMGVFRHLAIGRRGAARLRAGHCCSLAPILAVLVLALPGQAAERSAAPSGEVTPALPAALPLAEVATRAAEVPNLLRTLTALLAPDVQV